MKYLVFSMFIFLSFNSIGQRLTFKDLLGLWELKDSASIATLEFKDSINGVFYNRGFPNYHTYLLDTTATPPNKTTLILSYVMHNKHTGDQTSSATYLISKKDNDTLILEWKNGTQVYIRKSGD